MSYIFQDWKRNQGNSKGRIILVLFRVGFILRNNKLLMILFFPIIIVLKIFLDWFLNIDIPFKTKIGEGCIIYHGHSLVINADVVIGKNSILRHCVTIGNKGNNIDSRSPRIGDNMDIGSNSVIIGDIEIGDDVTIGSGSVVVKDVPSNCVVVGNPAKIIRFK
jgi:putative colanic acid biosynthesis acetyltransferase WcaB